MAEAAVADWIIAAWFVIYAAMMSYWEIAESLQPGQQYASPYLPCVWVAAMVLSWGLTLWALAWWFWDLTWDRRA